MNRTDKTPLNTAELDTLFAAGRDHAATPDPALLARVMADADAALIPATAPSARPARARRSLLANLAGAIGGWPALAGMATATLAGVWIGFAAPDGLDALAGGVLLPGTGDNAAYALEDMIPVYADIDGLLEEG